MLATEILPAIEAADAPHEVAAAQLAKITHAAGQCFDGIDRASVSGHVLLEQVRASRFRARRDLRANSNPPARGNAHSAPGPERLTRYQPTGNLR